GGEILLGDIAILSEQAEAAEEKVLYNGQRAAQLDIIKTQDQDSLEVMASLRAFLETEAQQAPPGVTVAITADLTSITSDRLNMLVENGLQGLVLVFLVMWLFFNLRYSLWITLGLPISFLGALFLMAHLGYSLNMITMVALIIAIGLLMDDAIVISENVHSQLKRGLSPIEAAIHGTRQVAPGVISSFLTTILIFGSLAFMGGDMGAVLKVLPVVLILVLAVSLIEAFLVLPNHLAHSLTDKDIHTRPESFRARFERGFDVLRLHLFGRLLDRAIRWRYLTLGILLSLVLLSISLAAGGVLKFRAFPDLDGNVVEARLLLPQGTPLTRTEELVGRLVEAAKQVNAEQIDQQPDGQDLIIAISERYAVNSDASESGPHVATVTLDLLSSEIRNGSTDDVIARWRDLVGPLPDVVFLKFTERQLGPGGKDIELRLVGQDLDALKQASNELIGWLGRYEGAHDLFDDLRPGKPELRVHLKDGAGAIGITAQTISDQLRAAFQGMTVSEVQSGPNAFEIDVRLSEQDRDSLGDLDDFTIVAPSGALVPLSAIAELDYGRGYARIARVNGQRVVTIEGSVDSSRANAAQIIAHTQTHFLPGFLERHPDVALNLKGQAEETSKTSSSLMRNFSLGLIGVFLLLTFQFRNYVEPVLVLTAIPMGLIGAFFGHVAQGLELSMPSIVGFASLAGVVVNDTILLVQFIKMRRALGDSAEDAARKAGRGRFRAILLTSVTTIAGLTPLLLETSLQAQVMIPLATSLAFGLLSATVLSLFFVPCFYLVLDDFGLSAKVGEEDKALAAEGLDNEPLDDPRP
ncbi:MAG: efflux RND transporter permease subunit, partial [Rhodospirillaceae bacterium]